MASPGGRGFWPPIFVVPISPRVYRMYLEPTKRTTATSLGFPETKSFRAYHGGTPTSVEMNVPAPRHVRKGDFGYTLYAMHRIAGRSIYRLIGGVQMFLGFELLVYICIRAPLTVVPCNRTTRPCGGHLLLRRGFCRSSMSSKIRCWTQERSCKCKLI